MKCFRNAITPNFHFSYSIWIHTNLHRIILSIATDRPMFISFT